MGRNIFGKISSLLIIHCKFTPESSLLKFRFYSKIHLFLFAKSRTCKNFSLIFHRVYLPLMLKSSCKNLLLTAAVIPNSSAKEQTDENFFSQMCLLRGVSKFSGGGNFRTLSSTLNIFFLQKRHPFFFDDLVISLWIEYLKKALELVPEILI